MLPKFYVFRRCAGDETLKKVVNELKVCIGALGALQKRGRLEVEVSLQVCTGRVIHGTHISTLLKLDH